MENLEKETISIHQEAIQGAALNRQKLEESGAAPAAFIDRMYLSIGDLLIGMGKRLKKHASTRLTTEESSNPSFLIML
jgi:hypothetical protein